MRARGNYSSSHIYAADEVGIWLDGLARTTVELTGVKEVGVRSTCADRLPITVLLAVRGNGVKLPPFVLIPRKRPIEELEKFRGQLTICYSGTHSWMDEEKTGEFLRTSVGRDIFGSRKLLVWDAFRPHYTQSTRDLCSSFNIDMIVIPGIN